MLMVWSKVLFASCHAHSLKFPGFSFSHPTDTTFTLTNVMPTLETVQDCVDLATKLEIPYIKYRLKDSDNIMNYYITNSPGASWSALAGALYYCGEQTALTKVTSYFQRQPGMCGKAFILIKKLINFSTFESFLWVLNILCILLDLFSQIL